MLLTFFIVVTPLLEKNIGVHLATGEVEECRTSTTGSSRTSMQGGLRVNSTIMTQADFIGR
jgi:hypothetical protein